MRQLQWNKIVFQNMLASDQHVVVEEAMHSFVRTKKQRAIFSSMVWGCRMGMELATYWASVSCNKGAPVWASRTEVRLAKKRCAIGCRTPIWIWNPVTIKVMNHMKVVLGKGQLLKSTRISAHRDDVWTESSTRPGDCVLGPSGSWAGSQRQTQQIVAQSEA